MRALNQLALKKETTPGTALTDLNSADVKVRLQDDSLLEPDGEIIETNEMQGSSSSRPVGVGARSIAGPASWVLRPSVTPLTASPPCHLFFEMGMLLGKQIKEITTGAVTGGPFLNGEIIRVGGNDRGVVFRNASASPLKYWVISGAIANTDVITGATSGATATASAGPVDKGWMYQLTDSDFEGGSDSKHHTTLEFMRGGYFWRGRGCLGELSFQFRNGRNCFMKQDILGAWDTEGDKALYAISTFPDEAAAAPRFVNTGMTMGAYAPTDIVDFSLNIPLGLELREDANHPAEAGVRYADYDRTNNPPIITFDPAMVKKATFDFFGKFKAEETMAVTWQLGTKFFFYADECQLIKPAVQSRRQLATVPIQLRLCGKTNNELQIYCVA